MIVCSSVLQNQRGLRIGGAERQRLPTLPIGADLLPTGNTAHLKTDFGYHRVVQLDDRLDIEFYPDIDVLHIG